MSDLDEYAGLLIKENGSMTNMAHFGVGPCAEHGPTCERIVKMEVEIVDIKEKVGSVEKKQDRFFWAILCGCAGIALTLLIAIINMTLNERMIGLIKTLHK